MEDSLQEIAKRIAHLLAESPLDDEIKKIILDGIDKLPEDLVYRLLDSLEAEREELEDLAFEIKLFLKNRDDEWKKLQEDQQKFADDFVNKKVSEIEDQIDLEQAREAVN